MSPALHTLIENRLNTLRIHTLVLLFAFGSPASAAAQIWVFSPGVKIGHRSGPNGGMTVGVELSVIRTFDNGFVAVVIGSDGMSGPARQLHVGLEAGSYFPNTFICYGLEAGPTFAWDDSTSSIGFAATAFTGAFILPYVRYETPTGNGHLETGAFLKIPLPIGLLPFH